MSVPDEFAQSFADWLREATLEQATAALVHALEARPELLTAVVDTYMQERFRQEYPLVPADRASETAVRVRQYSDRYRGISVRVDPHLPSGAILPPHDLWSQLRPTEVFVSPDVYEAMRAEQDRHERGLPPGPHWFEAFARREVGSEG